MAAKVYIVDYKSKADCKVFIVDYKSQAGYMYPT